jgi:hypothetical protein
MKPRALRVPIIAGGVWTKVSRDKENQVKRFHLAQVLAMAAALLFAVSPRQAYASDVAATGSPAAKFSRSSPEGKPVSRIVDPNSQCLRESGSGLPRLSPNAERADPGN